MNEQPIVTVLVPMRNEAADIGHCIEAIGKQDYPLGLLDVICVDGDSSDGTAAVTRQALEPFGFGSARVVVNQDGSTPSNLNRGLRLATGRFLCRVDARSRIPSDHVRVCAGVLASRGDVSVVGGTQHAVPTRRGAVSDGIARALNNRLAMGLARYRRRSSSGSTDTVYLGAFRTDELRRAGGWDERLATNQDFDLNRRMNRLGKVWYDTRLAVDYVARPSLRLLWRQYRRFGAWKVAYWRLRGQGPQPRQWVLLFTPLPALLGLPLGALMRPALIPWLIVGGLGVALVVDQIGSDDPPTTVVTRVSAVAAMATIATGWWTGVIGAALTRRRGRGAGAGNIP